MPSQPPYSLVLAENTCELCADEHSFASTRVSAAASEPSEVGTPFGERYRLEGTIAHGGMGDVYRGTHLGLCNPVAIKVLRKEYWGHAQVEVLFEQEARLGAKLGGIYVPRVFDLGHTEEGAPFIVSELLDGLDLRAFLDRSGTMALDYVLHLFLAICDAVASIHDHGVIHRDLKPGNLFLAHEPERGTCLKVLDFGIAKSADWVDVCSDSDFCAGSPVYMSPEQTISPETVDVRTDIWSLGVVLYEMLVGCTPAESSSLMGIRLTGPTFPPPSQARPEVPTDLDKVVLTCLARPRELRYSSVAELRDAATRVLESLNRARVSAAGPNTEPTQVAPQTKPRRRRYAPNRLSRWVKHGTFAHQPRMGV